MTEPTIDQAIEFLKRDQTITSPGSIRDVSYNLAIQALEEMKERRKDCCPHVGRCKDNKHIPAKCDQESRYRCPLRFPLPDKPRTWRDVTAGEMWDTCNDEGSQGFIKGCAEGHLWFHSKPTIPVSWRSMGV